MSKKRPSASQPKPSVPAGALSKAIPAHWFGRVFRNTYTNNGKLYYTRHWSVKIQHLGQRRTLSLLASDRAVAAAEACGLYKVIREHGWPQALAQITGNVQTNAVWEGVSGREHRLDQAYWQQRLVRRGYTMNLQAHVGNELSAYVEHLGMGYYFPLGTADANEGAAQALRIYQTLTAKGWCEVNETFSREVTIAFHWLDTPLLWTYTTLHTLNRITRSSVLGSVRTGPGPWKVTVVEPDVGIRRALAGCINQMDGFYCHATFATAEQAWRTIRNTNFGVVLLSSSLPNNPGPVLLKELSEVEPYTIGVLYSVYGDSQELFKNTPGGATTYLLQRTPPTQFLAPISAALQAGRIPAKARSARIRAYFKRALSFPPAKDAVRPASALTQREHEVLIRLSKGSPDKDIAARLRISIHTVHEHVRNIFDKLNVHNRTEAVVKFLQK